MIVQSDYAKWWILELTHHVWLPIRLNKLKARYNDTLARVHLLGEIKVSKLSFPLGFLVGLNKSEWDEISQSTSSGL